MEEPIFNIGNDSTLYKLNELILKNCTRFDCGVDDLNDLSHFSDVKVMKKHFMTFAKPRN